MKKPRLSTAAVAAAAAALFSAGAGTASAADEAKVKCDGANACKGQSACNTAKNSCAGANECAGKGWVMLTPAECDAAKAKQAEKAKAGK
jgi:hypothetical protein